MTTSKKKNIRWKALSAPLIVGAVGVGTFLGMNWLGDLSSANSSSISESNRVSVEGVENSAQYLTSMVLHMGDEGPNDTKVVTLYYDTGAKALHISGNVNANALIIGNKNEALSGTTAIGGEGNKILAGSENALIMGGKDNSLSYATNSIVLGGRGTKAASANNLAIIGASQTQVQVEGTGAPKENILVAGGHGNVVRGSNVVILGEGNNEAGSDSVLIGKDIKAGSAQKVFVWSDNGTFSPKKSGAFYVNTKNGIGFNTNDPKVKFDIGGIGGKGAIKITAKGGFVSESGKCNEEYAGLMAYVKAGGKSGLCGCNGAERVPLSSDPSTHGVCVDMKQRACTGGVANAVLSIPGQALPKWNPELKAGDGGWEDVKWVYGGIQYPGSTGKECGYICQTGYHAGADFPDGWQMGGCKACTEIANRYTKEKPDGSTLSGWWTPGTGNDNCHFGCKGGYKYKDQPGVERSCSGCNIGTYTPENNQRAECKDCVKPTINKQGLQEFITYASTRGGTATTINSGFKAWTTTGVSSTSCQFHCDERFGRDHRDLTNKGSCTFCAAGSYASGDLAQCALCSAITGAASWATNGSKDRTSTGSTKLDCDFNCPGGYAYKNNGGNKPTDRSCTRCEPNQRSEGKQQTTCENCPNNLPAGARYTGPGTRRDHCPWTCNDSRYSPVEQGGVKKCVKREVGNWVDDCNSYDCGPGCDSSRSVYCKDNQGHSVPDSRCRGSKPSTNRWISQTPCPPPPPPTPPTPTPNPNPPSGGGGCSNVGGACNEHVGCCPGQGSCENKDRRGIGKCTRPVSCQASPGGGCNAHYDCCPGNGTCQNKDRFGNGTCKGGSSGSPTPTPTPTPTPNPPTPSCKPSGSVCSVSNQCCSKNCGGGRAATSGYCSGTYSYMSHHACKFTKNKRNPTISRGKNCTETSKIIGQSYIRTVCYPESAAKDCASFDSMEQDTDPLGNTCNVYLRITGECVPQYQKNLSCSNVTEANCGKGTYYSCTRHPGSTAIPNTCR